VDRGGGGRAEEEDVYRITYRKTKEGRKKG
jgi:hypothetical protein